MSREKWNKIKMNKIALISSKIYFVEFILRNKQNHTK